MKSCNIKIIIGIAIPSTARVSDAIDPEQNAQNTDEKAENS